MASPQYPTPLSCGFDRYCGWRGLTLEDLSEKSGIAIRTLERWVAGHTVPEASGWEKLAKGFGFDGFEAFWLDYCSFVHANPSSSLQPVLTGEVRQTFPAYGAERGGEPLPSPRASLLQAQADALRVNLDKVYPIELRDRLLHLRARNMALTAIVEEDVASFFSLLVRARKK